jgi:hypothetical protein
MRNDAVSALVLLDLLLLLPRSVMLFSGFERTIPGPLGGTSTTHDGRASVLGTAACPTCMRRSLTTGTCEEERVSRLNKSDLQTAG